MLIGGLQGVEGLIGGLQAVEGFYRWFTGGGGG